MCTRRISLVGKCTTSLLGLLLISSNNQNSAVSAFSTPIFQESVALQRTAPSKTEGVDIELPDFDEFFDRIQTVSPLARLAMNGGGAGEGGGFAAVDDSGKFAKSSLIAYVAA
jgi:hypothetical protein